MYLSVGLAAAVHDVQGSDTHNTQPALGPAERCRIMDRDKLAADLGDAVLKKYVHGLNINDDWISYRDPKYEWNSASLREGRMNHPGQTTFYLASGDYCGAFEVPNHLERVKCHIKAHTVYAFDLHKFSIDYGYKDAFLQEQKKGGWAICQQVSDFLTANHNVSGVLYESAAAHEKDAFGYCMAILPGREQSLPDDFFTPPK
jgi:hypothetical protein